MGKRKQRVCSVRGCDIRHQAKGFCSRHYNQMKRIGHLVEGYGQRKAIVTRNVAKIPLANGYFVVVDADCGYLDKYSWHINRKRGFVTTFIGDSGRRRVATLARLIMNPPRGLFVVNKNGDKLDCRRENLAIVDKPDMSLLTNCSKRPCITKRRNRSIWQAFIKYRGRYLYMGQSRSLSKLQANALSKKRELVEAVRSSL